MKISKRKIFHKTDLLSRLYSCFFFLFLLILNWQIQIPCLKNSEEAWNEESECTHHHLSAIWTGWKEHREPSLHKDGFKGWCVPLTVQRTEVNERISAMKKLRLRVRNMSIWNTRTISSRWKYLLLQVFHCLLHYFIIFFVSLIMLSIAPCWENHSFFH